MQLPKYTGTHHTKKKLKLCQEPDCNKEYWGHPISKFCPLHSVGSSSLDRANYYKRRSKKRREVLAAQKMRDSNQKIEHSFTEPTDLAFTCNLEGCHKEFRVKVMPKQFVYPKFCEQHRNEHRRNQFLRGNDQ